MPYCPRFTPDIATLTFGSLEASDSSDAAIGLLCLLSDDDWPGDELAAAAAELTRVIHSASRAGYRVDVSLSLDPVLGLVSVGARAELAKTLG